MGTVFSVLPPANVPVGRAVTTDGGQKMGPAISTLLKPTEEERGRWVGVVSGMGEELCSHLESQKEHNGRTF